MSVSLPLDIIKPIFQFQSIEDICSGIQVCKSWGNKLESEEVWQPHFHAKGLPMVKGINTKLNVVYGNLFRRTISGEMFKEWYGEVRNIPLMKKEKYECFVDKNDPFISKEDPQQKIHETFWIVIDPSHVYRPYHEGLYNKLCESTNPKDYPEKSKDEQEMKIPFTLENRYLLIKYLHPDRK